jgi:hypothetical protein
LNFRVQFFDISIKLRLSKIKVEYILRVLSSADHALLDLSSIKCHNAMALRLSLEPDGIVKTGAHDLVAYEVVYSPLDIGLASHINHISEELSLVLLETLGRYLVSRVPRSRHVLNDEHVTHDALVFEVLFHVVGAGHRVHHQVSQALRQRHLDGDVILCIDWFDKFIELSKVPRASLFEFIKHLIEPGILSPDLLGYLHLLDFKFGLEELALQLLDFISDLFFGPSCLFSLVFAHLESLGLGLHLVLQLFRLRFVLWLRQFFHLVSDNIQLLQHEVFLGE